MSKSYDIGKKSDLDRFLRDLKADIKQEVMDDVHAQAWEMECPSCGETFLMKPGSGKCPACGQEVCLTLDTSKLDF